ncbi:MAG: hypothetical protein HDQ88_05125 [Clostridia bacterium]|nr:hypothetical protein [Clostridia bacterium]
MLQKLMLELTTRSQEYYMPTSYAAKVIANAFILKSLQEDVPVSKTLLAWLVAVANDFHHKKYGRFLISEQPEEINDEIVIPSLSYHYGNVSRYAPIEKFIYATQTRNPFRKRIAYFPPSSSFEIADSIQSAWDNYVKQI